MINKNYLIIALSVFIIFQLVLISHRVGFDLNVLMNFYHIDTAKKQSVKDKKAYEISQFILENKLKDFRFSNFQDNEEDSSTQERIVSYIYPIKYDKNSKNIISKNEINLNNCIKTFNYANLFLNEC